MKKVLFAIAAAAAMVCSCTKDLEDRVDALEEKVAALESKVNANVASIEQLVAASAKAVTVTSVVPGEDSYTITFSDGTTAVLTNGKDGQPGADGETGKKGDDGKTPVIGVVEIDGVCYWTVDGELLKYNGQNVPVKGTDGKKGEDGKTPQFKIVDGAWKVSFDGQNWETVPVSGTVAPTVTVDETDAAYVFTVGEKVITILKNLVIKVENYDVEINPEGTYVFNYTLSGADDNTFVLVEAKNFDAVLDTEAKTVTVTAPKHIENGYILLKAVRNTDSQYSAQYIVVKKSEYGIFGGVIITDSDPYTEW